MVSSISTNRGHIFEIHVNKLLDIIFVIFLLIDNQERIVIEL